MLSEQEVQGVNEEAGVREGRMLGEQETQCVGGSEGKSQSGRHEEWESQRLESPVNRRPRL